MTSPRPSPILRAHLIVGSAFAFLLSPLRALVFEPLLGESVAHSLGFEVGRDSVRAIRLREELGGFIDRKYFVRIECTHWHMAWHMVSWGPAQLREPRLYVNDGSR